jgi:hypothetical protein
MSLRVMLRILVTLAPNDKQNFTNIIRSGAILLL